jgi:6-phosphogluconolactonase (cycloisomerase 2 family)
VVERKATQKTALYASAGSRLIHFEVDLEGAALTERATIVLPADIQYAWPHASRRYLYVACSDGNPDSSGSKHWLSVLAIDGASGALQLRGAPVSLRWRPLHITTDIDSAHVLVTYNLPSTVSVHRINAEGSLGDEVAQPPALDCGIYAHQVRIAASNRRALVVTRGNDASANKPEDPGALKLCDYADGRLLNRASIAPGGGYGFGPRHVDFHPTQPWLYVSLERQNQLQVWDFTDESPGTAPLHSVGTLADAAHDHRAQKPGTVHVHPNGRFVYVANRARESKVVAGQRVFTGGENNIAVFAIDAASGKPVLIQNADIRGIAPRTFALDPGGRLLVAANLMPMLVEGAGGVTAVAAGLTVFRVGEDGRLDFMRKYDIDTGSGQLFWMGMVGL